MKTPLILCTVFAGFCNAGRAQESFTLEWSAISGGGGGASTEPAEFTLSGSAVGQFSSGESSGEPGEFTFTAGYWTFELNPPDLNLTMQLDGTTVTLTWDAGGPAAVLESSADLELWTPVDPQPAAPFFQEPESARRFYRLVP